MIAVTVQMSGEDMSLVQTHAKSCINNTMLKELNLKKKLWKDIRSEQASTDMTSVIDDNLHGITYIEIQSVDP